MLFSFFSYESCAVYYNKSFTIYEITYETMQIPIKSITDFLIERCTLPASSQPGAWRNRNDLLTETAESQ